MSWKLRVQPRPGLYSNCRRWKYARLKLEIPCYYVNKSLQMTQNCLKVSNCLFFSISWKPRAVVHWNWLHIYWMRFSKIYRCDIHVTFVGVFETPYSCVIITLVKSVFWGFFKLLTSVVCFYELPIQEFSSCWTTNIS